MKNVFSRETAVIVFALIALLCSQRISAQLCDPITPFYTVDMTGNPNGTWQSPSGHRDGLCCTAVSPDVCVEILITLDSSATGINFNIASGAVPPGALYYQIDCGVPTPVGQPICLDGPGPYHLTFCKPGNNPNSYSINSFGPPTIIANVNNVASPQCAATLTIHGALYDSTTLIWSSVPANALYNSFLSCTSGCATVTVMPSGNLPPYVDYRVCGRGFDPCNTATVCDTVRVYFYNALQVNVSPSSQILCNGVTSIPVTSTVTGGSGTYQYVWSNGNTTSSFTAGAGTYTLTVSDPVICSSTSASTTITVVPPIGSIAGNDITVCEDQPAVNLSGSIQTATSAIWTGGTGVFNPNNTSLNATYTPSAFEIASGHAQLILQTTANMGCPGAADTIQITIADVPVPVISGSSNACSNAPYIYSAPSSPGITYSWTVNGGIINGANNTNTVNVIWGSGNSGTVTLTMTNTFGCTASTSSNVNISQPITALAGNNVMICANQTSVQLSGSVQNATGFVWTGCSGTFSPGNTVLNPTYFPSATEIANGFAQLILQTSASQGCAAASDTVLVTISPMPNGTISGNTTICANQPFNYAVPNQAGATYSWTVNGGTFVGPSNGNSVSVNWGTGNSGTISLTVTSSAGCSVSSNATINVSQPITAIAGNDILICANQSSVQLSGSVQNATGYVWSGGTGTFSPGNMVLNPTYFPSAAEIANGYAQLILQTPPNQGCAAANDTIVVTISAMPVANISGSTTICASQPFNYTVPNQAGATYTWAVNGGSFIGPSNGNSVSVNWGTGNSGTVSLTVTNSAGCSVSSNAIINVSQPITAVAGNDILICANQSSVQLSGSVQNATGYVWTGGSGTFSPGNTALNPTYFPSAAEIANGYAQLILQTPPNQGCAAASDTIVVTISPMPDATLNGSTTICANQPFNYSVPNQAGVTYSWTVNGGSFIGPSNGNSVSVNWGTGNSGTVSLTVTNSAGCSVSSNAIINVSQPITAIAGNDILICADQSSVQLSGSVQNATGYVWAGGNGTFSPGNGVLNPTYFPSAAEISNGSAQLILQTPANQGCAAASDTIVVTISPMPDATLNGSTIICANQPLTYTVPFAAGTNYSWSVGGGVINGPTNSSSLNVSWGTGNSGTLQLTITSPAGCISTLNTTVSISQPVQSAAGPDVTICESENMISLNGSVQNTAGFLWTGGNGMFSPGNNVLNPSYTPTAAEIANGFVNLVLQTSPNEACASTSDSIHITINQEPDPAMTGNTVACANSNGSYSSPLQAGYTYDWSITGGIIQGSTNSNSISTTWGNTGPCSVMLTITNAAGCSSTAMQNISLVVLPNPVITGNNNPCQLSSVYYSVNPSQGSNYSWTVLNGNVIGGTTGNNINVQWLNPGSGTITVTETNSFGCIQSASYQTTVAELSIPVITGSSSVCTGSSSTTYSTTPVSNTNYSWIVNGGTILSGNGSSTINVQWNSQGTNSVVLTATNASGCDSTITFIVDVNSVNPISIVSTGLNGCPPLTVTFLGNQPSPGQVYQWSFGDQQVSTAANPTHTFTDPGNYQISVLTQNGPGCTDAANTTVQVYEEPDASFNHNFENEPYYIGESQLQITNTTFHGATHYWTFGNSEPVQAFEPEKVFDEQGDFLITLISLSAEGCPDTAAKIIHVKNHELMYFANAFSPNGDGTNDYFSMLYTNIKEITVNIFNRWGEVIYTSHDPDFKWSGYYNGREVENGVYVYRVQATGESGKGYVQIGSVTVLR